VSSADTGAPLDGGDARAATRRAWLFVGVAAAATALIVGGLKDEAVGFDLVQVYVPAAERVLDGVSPFPELDDPVWDGHQAYVYPPPTALLAVPLTVLPSPFLELAGVLGALALLLLALWLLGVRDPRVYAVFALWPTTLTAWQNANISVLLVLAAAATWRFRDAWSKAGIALGLGIALKLVLWPLSVWLLASRRPRAAAASVVVSVLAVVGGWAAIGFAGFLSYPDLLSKLTDVEGDSSRSVSIYSGALAFGLPEAVGVVVSLAAGSALLAVAAVLARRGDDRGSFTLALVAVLAFTPIVWLHYLTLLAIPLALYQPRLSALWAMPWLFWVAAVPGWPFDPRRALAFIVVPLVVAWLLTGRNRAPSAGSRSSVGRKSVAEAAR
jgi:alpha-1,2-mannosyltransferase